MRCAVLCCAAEDDRRDHHGVAAAAAAAAACLMMTHDDGHHDDSSRVVVAVVVVRLVGVTRRQSTTRRSRRGTCIFFLCFHTRFNIFEKTSVAFQLQKNVLSGASSDLKPRCGSVAFLAKPQHAGRRSSPFAAAAAAAISAPLLPFRLSCCDCRCDYYALRSSAAAEQRC
jgi:hypothetical protein